MLKDPGSGLNRGYGFIKYTSKEAATAAMEKLNNTEMKDHPGHQVCVAQRACWLLWLLLLCCCSDS